MTADIPRQPTVEQLAVVRALVSQGVVGPWHRRWTEMQNAASALGITPENAVYRVHDGCWANPTAAQNDDEDLTPADAIREAATR